MVKYFEKIIFFKKWSILGLFSIKHYNSNNKYKGKML